MHDGRMLFDANTTWNKQEWMVDETAGRLIEQNKVKPFESLTTTTQKTLYQAHRNPTTPLFAAKVYSDSYLKFIVKEVVPYIESNFSVNKGGANRYLAGSSMGGLISWYGLLQYPDEFAGAICISSHWPGTGPNDEESFPAFLSFIDNNLTSLENHKIYFDHGDLTLDAYYLPLQKQVDQLFKKHKFPAQQWHSEKSWAKRLEIPLIFMFGE